LRTRGGYLHDLRPTMAGQDAARLVISEGPVDVHLAHSRRSSTYLGHLKKK
jgi:hypothetical protein